MSRIFPSPDLSESMLRHMSFLRDSWTPGSPGPESPYVQAVRASGVKSSAPPSRRRLITRRPVPLQCVYCGFDDADTELVCTHFAHKQCIASSQDMECISCRYQNSYTEDIFGSRNIHIPFSEDQGVTEPASSGSRAESDCDILRSASHSDPAPSLASRGSTLASSVYDEPHLIDVPCQSTPFEIFVDGESCKAFLIRVRSPADAFRISGNYEKPHQTELQILESSKKCGINLNSSKWGILRLYHECRAGWSTDELYDTQAYLFENSIVVCKDMRIFSVIVIRGVEFESKVKLFPEDNFGLCIHSTTQSNFFLQFPPEIVWQWQATLLNYWKIPPPLPDGFVSRAPVKILVCLPACTMSALCGAIGRLQANDKLSVVTYEPNFCTSFHGPDWSGWSDLVAGFEIDRYHGSMEDLIPAATSCIVVDNGSQACPNLSGKRLHSVFLGSQDPTPLYRASLDSGGTFTTGKNIRHLLDAIVAAEKSYTHQDTILTIESSRPIHGIKGDYTSTQCVSKNLYSVNVGGLQAGTTRSLLVECCGSLEISASAVSTSSGSLITRKTRADPDFSNFNSKILLFKTIQMSISLLENQVTCDLVTLGEYLCRLSGETEEDLECLKKARMLVTGLSAALSGSVAEKLQALLVLRTGFAVLGQTDIERIFFEDLEVNVI